MEPCIIRTGGLRESICRPGTTHQILGDVVLVRTW